jgi:hypothetical protein
MTTARFRPCVLLIACVSAVALFATLPGCNVGGTSSTSAENDRLRRETLQLRRDLERAEGEKAELRVKLGESERSRTAALDPAVLEAIPRITRIDFGILSGVDDASRSPRLVRFDLTPLDGRGRFTQAVGTLTVEAAVLPPVAPGENALSSPAAMSTGSPLPGVLLATRTLTPAELREAYRSGLTSASYVVEVEPAHPVPESGDLVMRVSFSDALSGHTHTATKVTRLRPAR